MINTITITDCETGETEVSQVYTVPQNLDRQELEDWIDSLISEEIE